ncbi:MAG: NADH-quinone oxidoreductase subunit C [Bacteroidota bacterium]|nr:NADH-quinone oxidoreductase subunit C [Bacteroidota bacterium]
MSLTNESIRNRLTEKFGDELTNWEEPYGVLTFISSKHLNLKVLQFLFDDAELKFQFMTDLCAVHYPDRKGEELAVVYHLHNLIDNIRIRYKVYTDINKPDVFSATALYSAANWMEREAYDFYGVNFVGHPNLIRIQNVEEMEYFPQRKEYPLEDQSRIDKDDEMFGRGGTMVPSGDARATNRTVSEDEKTGDI